MGNIVTRLLAAILKFLIRYFFIWCALFLFTIEFTVNLIINNFYFHIIICTNNTFVYKVTKKKKNMMSKIRIFMDP